MKKIILVYLVILLGLLSFADFVSAATKNTIFDFDVLTSDQSAGLWQIFNNTEVGLSQKGDGFVLQSDGDAYLVYNESFSYQDYDQLSMVVSSDKPLLITIIANVSTTGENTYELRRKLEASNEPEELTVSLRLPFFKDPISDLGINFHSDGPAEIFIKEISLEKLNPAELAVVAVKDYWQVFEYSPFTVNLFAAPRIFGHSALVYFLPLIFILIFLFFFNQKYRRLSLILLLAFWILVDIRMTYEFFRYNQSDYTKYVKPEQSEKKLRTYGDFYSFADWVKDNLGNDQVVNFYSFGSAHFPRLLQYLVYPIVINDGQGTSNVYLIYNRRDISYNNQDRLLYLGSDKLSDPGEVIAWYNDFSFIFKEQ